MQKKFVLIVRYVSGEVAMLTSTPELSKALDEFLNLENNTRYWDKGTNLPEIQSVKIVPLLYESIYESKQEEK